MRSIVYICDNCGRELDKEGDVVSPHISIEGFNRSQSGWMAFTFGIPSQMARSNMEYDGDPICSRKTWQCVKSIGSKQVVVNFCSTDCLKEYFDKLLQDYKINKLKE